MTVFHSHQSVPIKKYGNHTHSTWEIIAVVDGTLTTTVAGVARETSAGDIVILPPSTPHVGVSAGTFVDLSLLIDFLPYKSVMFLHDYDGGIRTVMSLINNLMIDKDAGYAELCSSLGECLVKYINKSTSAVSEYIFLNELKAQISKNLSNPDFDVAKAVSGLGYNLDYVRRCFKKEFGTTPLKYVTDLRLARAKELLLSDSFISVENVSEQCGFSDCFYFSTVFKKNFGSSPRSFRKSNYKKSPIYEV